MHNNLRCFILENLSVYYYSNVDFHFLELKNSIITVIKQNACRFNDLKTVYDLFHTTKIYLI